MRALVLALLCSGCAFLRPLPSYSNRVVRNWMSDCTQAAQASWCACALVRFQAAGVQEQRIFEQLKTRKTAPDLIKLVEACQ